MTSFFYIRAVDLEADLKRCRQSQALKTPVVMSGETEESAIKIFQGVVLAIEEVGHLGGSRWRVTVDW